MTHNNARLYEALYVSTLAPGIPLGAVADIAVTARLANEKRQLTGLLIFDGMRFCQQLEGSPKEVLRLLDRICQDPRHTRVEILHHGPVAERRFRRFCLGYSSSGDEGVLARFEQLDGQQAVEAFLALLPSLDLEA